MQCDRERFQERGRHEVDAVGDAVHDPPRHGDELGEAAVAAIGAGGDAEYLAVGAEVFPFGVAVFAGAAKDGRIERDTATDREIGHAGADRFDGAGRLVPHYERRNPPARAAGVAMHVGAADSTGGDPHEHLTGRGGGSIDIGHREGAGRGKEQGLHMFTESHAVSDR